MPCILSTGISVPPHVLHTAEARAFARDFFSPAFPDIDRRLSIFDNAGIETRHIARPVEWFLEPRTFAEKNAVYIEVALDLCAEAADRCLAAAGISRDRVDSIIVVSTTGLATPSLDARLIGRLGFGPRTRRLPVWGLGCAGGVAGVAQAYHQALGNPDTFTLVVAVELCSLTFHQGDRSLSNLVATALFGDGAAAVLVAGDRAADGRGIAILDTRSTLYPDSLDVMGWNLETEGLQVVFSRRIPEIVLREARPAIAAFLDDHAMKIADVDPWILHPGGMRILEAFEMALGVDPRAFVTSRDILREYGNMSSASVLFVLDRILKDPRPSAASRALLAALGPGFSLEQVLVDFPPLESSAPRA